MCRSKFQELLMISDIISWFWEVKANSSALLAHRDTHTNNSVSIPVQTIVIYPIQKMEAHIAWFALLNLTWLSIVPEAVAHVH